MKILLYCFLGLIASVASSTNVIFIIVDDLGYMDVGFNNPRTFYETPFLDELAEESMVFTNSYAASPVCSPTRSSVLTGQYPSRTRNSDYFGADNGHDVIPKNPRDVGQFELRVMGDRPILPAPYLNRLSSEHITLAEYFKVRGYATMHAGKWHLGEKGSWPEDHGFDINIGGGAAGGPYTGEKYFSPYDNPNLPNGPRGEHLPDRLASEVVKFIRENKDSPFFVYLSFYSVHTPLMAPQSLVEKYRKKREILGLSCAWEDEFPRRNRMVQDHAVYAGMVESMDAAVGKVIGALNENHLRENTIIVFFSDNGGLSTNVGSPTSNRPFRAGKGWAYEGGVRVPTLVSWVGNVQSGRNDTPIISTDFYPTLLELCGMNLIDWQHLDGVSFASLLKDKTANHKRKPLFWHYPHWGNNGGIPFSAIRDGDWKLIKFYYRKEFELYNLVSDPFERENLAELEPHRLNVLLSNLEDFLDETGALLPVPNPKSISGFETW